MDIIFRPAITEDAERISKLIVDSQREFCFHEYTDEGIELMLRLCSAKAIEHYLNRGDKYFVAIDGIDIIGVAGIRDNEHLTHNFVAVGWHRKGISKHLWKLASTECRKNGNPGMFNLNASTFAIPIYEAWGFVQTGPTAQENGITSTPMEANNV